MILSLVLVLTSLPGFLVIFFSPWCSSSYHAWFALNAISSYRDLLNSIPRHALTTSPHLILWITLQIPWVSHTFSWDKEFCLSSYELCVQSYISAWHSSEGASQMVLAVNNPLVNAGDTRDTALNPGLGRWPGVGHGSLLHYCCLENSMDRGAWKTAVHGAAKSDRTECTHTCDVCVCVCVCVCVWVIECMNDEWTFGSGCIQWHWNISYKHLNVLHFMVEWLNHPV